MGKSEGNAFQIKWYRQSGVDPNLIRFWVLQANYRKPLSKEALDDGSIALQWAGLQEKLRHAPKRV
jgi:cysteinyl-tRNA synthetase